MTTDTVTRQPGFILLEDEGPSAPAAPAQPAAQPSASSPEAAAPAAAPFPTESAAPAARKATEEKPRPTINIAPGVYCPPDLGGTYPLSEVAQTELDVASSKELAVDVKEKQAGVSKVKLGVTAAAVVAALLIGWTLFGPSPPPFPVAQPTALPQPGALQPGVPTAGPTGTGAPGTPAAPTVGIDIGNTVAIPLETGDIDMIEQWAPVAPAEQSCSAQALSPYLQAVCTKVGQARYFACAPDGFHWDYRIEGCAQL